MKSLFNSNYLQKLVLCDQNFSSQGCLHDTLLTKVTLPLHKRGLAREEYFKIKNYNIVHSLAPLPDKRKFFGITSKHAMSSSYIITHKRH